MVLKMLNQDSLLDKGRRGSSFPHDRN